MMVVSQILRLCYCIHNASGSKTLGREITSSGDLGTRKSVRPTRSRIRSLARSHAIQERNQKNEGKKKPKKKSKTKQGNGTEADTWVREGTFLYRQYNMLIDTASTLKRNL